MILKKYDPDADRASLPTHKDLPDSDGAIVESFLEHPQSFLLTDAIFPLLEKLHPDGQFAIGMDTGIYWKITEPSLAGCKAPDWFYVPGVSPTQEGEVRRSYVLWQELVPPRIVIEYVSRDGKEEHDATPETGKFWVYEQGIGAEYYLIYDFQHGGKIEGFHLEDGRYRTLKPNKHGHIEVPPMGVALGLWKAEYRNQDVPWLRWYDLKGKLVPISEEIIEKDGKRILKLEKKAHEERERADRLAEKLRQLGVDPDAK